MQEINFEEELVKILEKDTRYRRDAYSFLREALDHTQTHARKPKPGEVHHVTGQQLLEGIRQYALQQYGPMALTLLNEWGVHRSEDFGEIVFNMVECRLLAKTETDRREDFRNAYDFHEAFHAPFVPASKTVTLASEPTPSQV